MLFSCSKLRLASASDTVNCLFNRNCVLDAIFHSRHTTNRIRMPLADTFAPECIRTSLHQNGLCIQTIQREHTRIPTYGNDSNLAARFCLAIHICKIFRNLCVRVKTINGVKILHNLRTHNRKIRCRTSTKHHHINLILHRQHVIKTLHSHTLCVNLHTRRISSCKYRFQLHILIARNRKLHTSADVTITYNTNSNFLHNSFKPLSFFQKGTPRFTKRYTTFFIWGRRPFKKVYVPKLTNFRPGGHVFFWCHQCQIAVCVFCAQEHAFGQHAC